jgi:CheY-like chemotaxis protein
MGDKKIILLHIEDDSVDKMVVERVLKKMDIVSNVHHASNGEEALNKLKGTNGEEKISPLPHVILLDINMPKMNGLEFLKELRSDPELKHISVYMVTTSSDDSDVAGAYEYNVAGYILKPVDIAHFEGTFKLITDFWKLCEFPKN